VSGQVFQLYRAPIDLASAPQLLAQWPWEIGPFSEDGEPEGSFRIAPNDERVVYQNGGDAYETGEQGELFSVPLFGGPSIELTQGIPANYGVRVLWHESALRMAADHVVFLAGRDIYHPHLFAAPIDGSSAARELNGPMQFGAGVDGFEVLGEHVVFIADVVSDGRFELFHVPLRGSAGLRTKICQPLVTYASRPWEFLLRPGSVLYNAAPDAVSEIFLSSLPRFVQR